MSSGSDSITVTATAFDFWHGVLGSSTTTMVPRSGDGPPSSAGALASRAPSAPASIDAPPDPALPASPVQVVQPLPVVSRWAGGAEAASWGPQAISNESTNATADRRTREVIATEHNRRWRSNR